MTQTGPTCPCCAAPWTEPMLAHFDAMSMPGGCACCGDAPSAEALPVPTEDLVCASCGRAIYLNPHAAQ